MATASILNISKDVYNIPAQIINAYNVSTVISYINQDYQKFNNICRYFPQQPTSDCCSKFNN